MTTARDNVFARVRKALGRTGPDEAARAAAEAYLAARVQGPRPALNEDLVERFLRRAQAMQSSVERIADKSAIPRSVGRYLDGLEVPAALAGEKINAGVCWPDFTMLDWTGAGLNMESRPATGKDRLAVTGVFCAIAETGTMVIVSGAPTPTASILLPETHIAVVPAQRIVAGMEEAFALLRRERGALPRAVNMVSGPSRTGDIEQTIVLGAHGPYRVHILIV